MAKGNGGFFGMNFNRGIFIPVIMNENIPKDVLAFFIVNINRQTFINIGKHPGLQNDDGGGGAQISHDSFVITICHWNKERRIEDEKYSDDGAHQQRPQSNSYW